MRKNDFYFFKETLILTFPFLHTEEQIKHSEAIKISRKKKNPSKIDKCFPKIFQLKRGGGAGAEIHNFIAKNDCQDQFSKVLLFKGCLCM